MRRKGDAPAKHLPLFRLGSLRHGAAVVLLDQPPVAFTHIVEGVAGLHLLASSLQLKRVYTLVRGRVW